MGYDSKNSFMDFIACLKDKNFKYRSSNQKEKLEDIDLVIWQEDNPKNAFAIAIKKQSLRKVKSGSMSMVGLKLKINMAQRVGFIKNAPLLFTNEKMISFCCKKATSKIGYSQKTFRDGIYLLLKTVGLHSIDCIEDRELKKLYFTLELLTLLKIADIIFGKTRY